MAQYGLFHYCHFAAIIKTLMHKTSVIIASQHIKATIYCIISWYIRIFPTMFQLCVCVSWDFTVLQRVLACVSICV